MNGFENQCGISVSSVRMQLVELSFNENVYSISNIDEAYYSEPVNFANEKSTKLSALLQGAYNEILIRKALKSKSVSFSLPMEIFHFLQVPIDDSLLQNELIDELKWELSVALPFLNSDELALQYIEIPPNRFCDSPTALVSAIERKYIGILNSFCTINKLRLRFIDNIHFASERTLAAQNIDEVNGVVLSLYITNSSLSIMITMDGKMISFASIPFESISSIAELIKDDVAQNKLLKIGFGDISNAYIFGDDVTDGFVTSLSDVINLRLIKINPFTNFQIETNSSGLLYQSDKFNSFASAAGIAFRTA